VDGQASRAPGLGEVINRAVARGQAELRVSTPCVVVSYNVSQQTVTVQPQIADAYLDENSDLQFEMLPQVSGVPVHFPSGGNLRITFPIQPGDTGMIVVCDRSIDAWKSSGGTQQPVDARRHHIADAWFECGVNPNGKWANADPSVISIGDDALTADFVATAQRTLSQLSAIVNSFNSHTHSGVTTGPGSSGPPVVLMVGPSAPASATVKILG
jgi:hypothetical protein